MNTRIVGFSLALSLLAPGAALAANAQVEADRANIQSAKVQLDYATIAAPISGRTGLLQVHKGNLVRAQDTAPIVTINRITPVYVSFGVPESMLPQFKKYMAAGTIRVEAKAPNDPDRPSVGKIDFIEKTQSARNSVSSGRAPPAPPAR